MCCPYDAIFAEQKARLVQFQMQNAQMLGTNGPKLRFYARMSCYTSCILDRQQLQVKVVMNVKVARLGN